MLELNNKETQMKKLLTIVAFCATLAASQAAQINWGLTGAIQFDGTKVGANGATLTLVYLNTGASTWSADALTIAQGKTTETAETVATKNTNNGSQALATASPWAYDWGDTTTISSSTVKKGSVFAYIATTVQDGKTYYWASDTYTVTDSGDNWDSTALKYTMSQTAASGPNNNWKAVPEPSTAALALAGLALLLKRRKA